MKTDYINSRRQRGTSLAEVLIALGLSAIIASSLAMLFSRSVTSRAQVDQDGQRIEAGRYALDTMSEDIRLAGFFGDFMPRGTNGAPWPATDTTLLWQAPDPCATTVSTLGWYNGDSSSASTPSPAPVPSTLVHVPVAVYGYQAPAVGALTCLTNRRPNTDVLVVRRASTVSFAWNIPTAGQWNAIDGTTGSAVVAGDFYLQASICSNDTQRFAFNSLASATAATGFNTLRTMTCGTANTPIRRYIQRIYYVATCNECTGGSADTLPTLKMAELSVGGIVIRSVTPGVENLHFEYGVDAGADGSADSYLDANAAPTVSTPFGWQNVMAIRTYLLVRDLQATNQFTNSNTYVMGTRTIASPGDAFRRTVFTSTVRLTNPSAARETS